MRPILLAFGGWQVLSAPVFAGLSGLLAYFYCERSRPAGLSEEDFWGLILRLALGTMVGAALAYLFLYGGGLEHNLRFMSRRRAFPGGAFYGSFWGAFALAGLYCLRRRIDLRGVADMFGTAAPLGLALMRLGCTLNGCCHGRPTTLPWGIVFTDPRCAVPDRLLGVPLHPSQLYEAAGALGIFLFLHLRLRPAVRRGALFPGALFCASAALYAVLRFLLDFTRGGEGGVLDAGLATSQWTSLATLAAAALLARRWKTAR